MDSVSTSKSKTVPKAAATDDYYINVKNKSNLSFKEMWNRTDLSDLKLCCDTDEFRLHRFLLAACSPYFRHLFEKRPDSNQNIILEHVNGDDLRRVLLYMYHGSVMIKNDDIQGFCELLEMFLMPMPDDVAVSDSESESENEMESQSESDSEEEEKEEEEEIEESIYDEFVRNVRDALNNLTEENVQNQSSTILNLADMTKQKIEVIVNLILESVVQPKPNIEQNLFVLLVKHICDHSRDDTFYFHNELRLKTLRLFASGERNFPNQSETPSIPSNEIDRLNSLDKQVYLMQSIDFHCTSVRYQRLAHFIGHLFRINLIHVIDINDLIKKSSPQYKDHLLGNKHTEKNCCHFQLPQVVDDICNDDWYRSVSPLANHVFWTRSQTVLGSAEPNRFKHISKEEMFLKADLSRSQRKQNRNARKERLAPKNQVASKATKQLPKPSQQGSNQ